MKKHSVRIAGHPTSITLEPEFWAQLNALAAAHGKSLTALVTEIDESRGERNLSSAIRVYILSSLLSLTDR